VLEISTWYAEVAAPKRKLGGNQSLLGISQGLSFWLPSWLLILWARDLRLRSDLRFLLFCDEEERCREEVSLLGPIWLLRPGWAVWFMAEAARSRAISC